jgi:hypothetical protein
VKRKGETPYPVAVYVYRVANRWGRGIRCANTEVARSVCLQLNLIGIPKDKNGYRLYDKVTWVVASA